MRPPCKIDEGFVTLPCGEREVYGEAKKPCRIVIDGGPGSASIDACCFSRLATDEWNA